MTIANTWIYLNSLQVTPIQLVGSSHDFKKNWIFKKITKFKNLKNFIIYSKILWRKSDEAECHTFLLVDIEPGLLHCYHMPYMGLHVS